LKKIKSPVDGMLLSLKVAPGDTVTKGQIAAVVLILKMENPVPFACDGIVKEIPVKLRDRIKRGQILMLVDDSPTAISTACDRFVLNKEHDPRQAEELNKW